MEEGGEVKTGKKAAEPEISFPTEFSNSSEQKKERNRVRTSPFHYKKGILDPVAGLGP